MHTYIICSTFNQQKNICWAPKCTRCCSKHLKDITEQNKHEPLSYLCNTYILVEGGVQKINCKHN